MTDIIIPSSVTLIHNNAFYYCTSLNEIKVHSNPSNTKKLIFPAGVKVTYI